MTCQKRQAEAMACVACEPLSPAMSDQAAEHTGAGADGALIIRERQSDD
jgi:hypothetical protein